MLISFKVVDGGRFVLVSKIFSSIGKCYPPSPPQPQFFILIILSILDIVAVIWVFIGYYPILEKLTN